MAVTASSPIGLDEPLSNSTVNFTAGPLISPGALPVALMASSFVTLTVTLPPKLPEALNGTADAVVTATDGTVWLMPPPLGGVGPEVAIVLVGPVAVVGDTDGVVVLGTNAVSICPVPTEEAEDEPFDGLDAVEKPTKLDRDVTGSTKLAEADVRFAAVDVTDETAEVDAPDWSDGDDVQETSNKIAAAPTRFREASTDLRPLESEFFAFMSCRPLIRLQVEDRLVVFE